MTRDRWRLGLGAALLLAGCAGPQSSLDPAGPSAAAIDRLGSIMFTVATLVTLLVTALMLVPFVRRRERTVNRKIFLIGGGVALPLLTLTILVPYIMSVGQETRASVAPDRLSVDITGRQFWWEMSYRRGDADSAIRSANELRLPVGVPVELRLHANDVIHSLWIPSLAGKTDLIPGRVNRMVIRADRAGVYRGQCAEYCGLQHALMAFEVVVMPRAEFDAWLGRLARPVGEPPQELREGRDLFVRTGCGACHTVRGVAQGRLGPDLTQVGARRMIGSGALEGGGVGNIAGWIASAQHLKPGNAMPSFNQLPGPQLHALAGWLESLR